MPAVNVHTVKLTIWFVAVFNACLSSRLLALHWPPNAHNTKHTFTQHRTAPPNTNSTQRYVNARTN